MQKIIVWLLREILRREIFINDKYILLKKKKKVKHKYSFSYVLEKENTKDCIWKIPEMCISEQQRENSLFYST